MCAKKTGTIEDLAVVGIDIGKDIFHLVGFDQTGRLVMRKQIKRLALNATFEGLPRCIVGMEACLSAHFVGRTLRAWGSSRGSSRRFTSSRSTRARKTITTTRRPRCGRTSGPSLRRTRSSSTFRPCTGSGHARFRGARPPSTRSGPS